MTEPLVSIIIPCYNAARYVGEAIDSALGQTYPRKEVIVIDDGSTDGSLGVIESYGERIRWESGPNRGACAARNRGLSLARGELVQFLDADDLLHSEKLSRQVPLIRPEGGQISFCDWESERLDGGEGQLYCSSLTHNDSVILAVSRIISTPAPLYPRHLLEAVGGWNEQLPCAQDFDLNLRLACGGAEFRRVAEVLVTVRRHRDSVSADFARVLEQFPGILQRCYRQLRENGALTDVRARAFAAAMATHGRAALRLGLADFGVKRFEDARAMHDSGGMDGAYRMGSRILCRLLGPLATERIVQIKREMHAILKGTSRHA